MQYSKPALTIQQQINLLSSRGLIIKDQRFAEAVLQQISYYRLSAYCIPFQLQKDKFHDGTSFESVYRLYRFDHDLRILVFDVLERVEVAIRAKITYVLARELGAFGYLNRENYHQAFKWGRFDQWMAEIEDEIGRSREVFIAHYKIKYAESKHFPIWMASEVFSFGKLSQLYSGLAYKYQKKIAREFLISHEVLKTWLHTLVYVRNVCAHHSRFWNKTLAIQPSFPSKDVAWTDPFIISNQKAFAVFSIMKYLMDLFEDGVPVKSRLIELFSKNPQVNIEALGFPKSWMMHRVWKS